MNSKLKLIVVVPILVFISACKIDFNGDLYTSDLIDVAEHLSLTLVNMRFAKPLDTEKIEELAKTHLYFITIEDNVVTGGAGSSVNEYINENGLFAIFIINKF